MYRMIKSMPNIDREQAIYGLSTDTKPITSVEGGAITISNGCVFYCMDTKQVYMYDEENTTWLLQ